MGWIRVGVYLILVWLMEFENGSEGYYMGFGNLGNKRRVRWKISMWILVVGV